MRNNSTGNEITQTLRNFKPQNVIIEASYAYLSARRRTLDLKQYDHCVVFVLCISFGEFFAIVAWQFCQRVTIVSHSRRLVGGSLQKLIQASVSFWTMHVMCRQTLLLSVDICYNFLWRVVASNDVIAVLFILFFSALKCRVFVSNDLTDDFFVWSSRY